MVDTDLRYLLNETVVRILSAFILSFWLLCWTHCTLSQYGSPVAEMACECCHEDSDETDKSPCHEEPGCEVCEYLTKGSTLISHIEPAPAVFSLIAEICFPPALMVQVASKETIPDYARGPPPRLRLCEFLARTGCPVRGPTVSMV